MEIVEENDLEDEDGDEKCGVHEDVEGGLVDSAYLDGEWE